MLLRTALLAAPFLIARASPATAAGVTAADLRAVTEASRAQVPSAPWASGDERGMGNTQGSGTWGRCAFHLTQPNAKVYELAHIHSNSMPMAFTGKPSRITYNPTMGLHDTVQAFNSDETSGSPGAQGTHIDALGQFAYGGSVWDGKSAFASGDLKYYGGFGQAQVKPAPDSPLLKLGVDKIPPIVTSAVLLDARSYLGHGEPMKPGQQISAQDIEAMIRSQGLAWRGLLPGDALYIYTGWEDKWQEPAKDNRYFEGSPGLATDAARYLGGKSVVLVGLDNPFTDPMQVDHEARNAGVPKELFFAAHHYDLTQNGVYQVQNTQLSQLAKDHVWLSCTMVLPSRDYGSAAAPVRPIAIGARYEAPR